MDHTANGFPYVEDDDPITDYPAVDLELAGLLDDRLGAVGGWLPLPALTYTGADAPVFTATAPVDLTARLGVGARIKLTQTTAKYFIVVAISVAGGVTTLTLYGGTDYTLANAAITAPYYSREKAPVGFPTNPAKWTIEVKDTTHRTQANATQLVWYNPGGIGISIPVGAWSVEFSGVAAVVENSTAQGDVYVSLSTANNSETDTDFTSYFYDGNASANGVQQSFYRRKLLVKTVKTFYYAIAKSGMPSPETVGFANGNAPFFLRATCAYL